MLVAASSSFVHCFGHAIAAKVPVKRKRKPSDHVNNASIRAWLNKLAQRAEQEVSIRNRAHWHVVKALYNCRSSSPIYVHPYHMSRQRVWAVISSVDCHVGRSSATVQSTITPFGSPQGWPTVLFCRLECVLIVRARL